MNSYIWHDYSNSTFFHERDLAEKGSTVIDYTVFGMAVITIGLLMVVGAVRYFIDAMAKGRFFFENVLEAVYHELSTLGLVEAGVFLILHYYPGLNMSVKTVFAEVHFTLFYVAIINAIMSVLLYLFTSKVAEKQWVRMETIDLDHYVAIRKQFEAIELALKEIEENDKMKKTTYNQVSLKTNDDPSSRGRKVEFAENAMTSRLSTRSNFERDSFPSYLKSLINFPVFGSKRASLVAKHRKLLVQVRFHELRVHFIDCNKLDPRFKVSDYLKRCMNDVFHSLVHISFVTWLILLFFTNVVYFCLGVISAFADEATIGTILTWVHVGYSLLFLLASLLIANKMKSIFFLIMKNDHWIRRDGSSEVPATFHRQMSMSNVRDARADTRNKPSETPNNINQTRQEDYFWGGDPAYIVFAAQVMQFGFALELGIMLVFNESVKINAVDLGWWGFYLLVPLLGYLLFLWIWSLIIPQFTQCTSLGELIHSDHLNETQAMFKLTEARLLRQEEIDMAATEDAINKRMISNRRGLRKKQVSAGGLIGKLFDSVHSSHKRDHDCDSFEDSCGDKLMQLSSFVKKDTKDLPDIEPSRRRRRKAVSDGVSAMRFFTPLSSSVKQALEDDMESEFENLRHRSMELSKSLPKTYSVLPSRPHRLKSASTGIVMMRHGGSETIFSDSNDKNANLTNLKSRDDNDIGMFFSSTLSRVDEGKPISKHTSLGESKTKVSSMSKTETNLEYSSLSNHSNLYIPKSGSEHEKILAFPHPTNEEESDVESTGFPDLSDHPEFHFDDELEIPFSDRMKSFFMDLKYRRLSAVFGTLLVFFLLGTRMELILLKTCKIEDNQNTWDYISLKSTFIMTTLWLCGFIFESSTLIYTFYTSTLNSMVAAGIFDILLSITCLSIFLVAETQRCCDCEGIFNRRILAADDAAIDSNKTCEILCCPAFGTRLCGGIGTLEPFTSLIVLRLFRFFVGKWLSRTVMNLMNYFNPIKSCSDEEKEIESKSEDITEKEKDESSEKLVNIFEHKEGTIADLWAASLLKFPDLVEKHGPFSGLLLEAMLGIQPAPKRTPQPEASVKPLLPAETKQSSYSRSLSIGSVKSAIDSIDENERAFDRPASTLIRTMRRCQCKWLPLLDSWEDVDVVLTKYELAWFATTSADSSWDDEANEKYVGSKRLLKKSGGGKGLRLCDVVSGRELLGRIQLHDIESVKVMRYPKEAIQRKVLLENDEEFGKEPSGVASEYWQEGKQSTEYENVEERWSGVTEDVLTIRTPQGTLCLRFLVDLVSAEEMLSNVPGQNTPSKRKRKEEGALLWCKTILYIQSKEKGFHIEHDKGGDATDYSDIIELVGDTKKQRRWFQNTIKNRKVENVRIRDNEK